MSLAAEDTEVVVDPDIFYNGDLVYPVAEGSVGRFGVVREDGTVEFGFIRVDPQTKELSWVEEKEGSQ